MVKGMNSNQTNRTTTYKSKHQVITNNRKCANVLAPGTKPNSKDRKQPLQYPHFTAHPFHQSTGLTTWFLPHALLLRPLKLVPLAHDPSAGILDQTWSVIGAPSVPQTLAQQLGDVAGPPDALLALDVRDVAPGGLVAADLALGVALVAIAGAPGRRLVDGLEGAVRLVEGLAVRVVQLVLVQQLLALVVLEVLEEDAVLVLVLPLLLLRVPLPGLQLRRHVGGDFYGPVPGLKRRREGDGSRQDERQDGEDHFANVLHFGSYWQVLGLVRFVGVW